MFQDSLLCLGFKIECQAKDSRLQHAEAMFQDWFSVQCFKIEISAGFQDWFSVHCFKIGVLFNVSRFVISAGFQDL